MWLGPDTPDGKRPTAAFPGEELSVGHIARSALRQHIYDSVAASGGCLACAAMPQKFDAGLMLGGVGGSVLGVSRHAPLVECACRFELGVVCVFTKTGSSKDPPRAGGQ